MKTRTKSVLLECLAWLALFLAVAFVTAVCLAIADVNLQAVMS